MQLAEAAHPPPLDANPPTLDALPETPPPETPLPRVEPAPRPILHRALPAWQREWTIRRQPLPAWQREWTIRRQPLPAWQRRWAVYVPDGARQEADGGRSFTPRTAASPA